jgi:hypothetical protein
MEKRIGYRSMGKLAAAAAVGLAGFSVSQADASVIIDVRATQVNGVAAADPRAVTVAQGDVVSYDIFATVTGTNGVDDEGFQAINGAIRSSTGGLLGNLSNSLVAPFNGNGSSAGAAIDVDSDGDLDISGPNQALAGSYFNPRNSAGFSTDGVRVGEGETFKIATGTFTVTGNDGTTVVDYLQHKTSTGANNLAWGTFLIDGNNGGTSPRNPVNTPISTAGGITVTASAIPEPTGLALAGLGTLGLLARRRNKKA